MRTRGGSSSETATGCDASYSAGRLTRHPERLVRASGSSRQRNAIRCRLPVLRKATALVAAVLCLGACDSRPETPAYFHQVTSLRLCSRATVMNVNAKAPDRSPGFDSIYIVRLKIPPQCRADFFASASERAGSDCRADRACDGIPAHAGFLRVEPEGATVLVTYST